MKKIEEGRKSFKRIFTKLCIYFGLFLSVFIISLFTNLPKYFDSYVQIENYQFIAHFWLIIYRLIMYFSFPFIVSTIEKMIFNGRRLKYGALLIENFNIQFVTYAVIASLYAVFGVDKILSVDIFGNADAFLFMTGFVLTTIINGGIPDMISK